MKYLRCYCYTIRFLSSFLIDARGGTVQGSRHAGVQVVIPPGKVCMPTRITCKLVRADKLISPPRLKEGEAVVSRGLELGPVGFQFNGFVHVPCWTSIDVVNNYTCNTLQFSLMQSYLSLYYLLGDIDIILKVGVSMKNTHFCFPLYLVGE